MSLSVVIALAVLSVFGLAIASFVSKIVKLGGISGVAFGAPIVRTVGEVSRTDSNWVNVGVLAGNIYVLAQRYDADPQRVSAAILLSTLVSVVSFPCVGLARARLKRVAIRASVNGGFNRPVTLRSLDLSGPDHIDWYAFHSPHFEIPELVRVA